MRREGVPLETEWTDPEFAPYIDLAVRVEDCATRCFARDGFVQDRREVGAVFERSVELYQRGNDLVSKPHSTCAADQGRKRERIGLTAPMGTTVRVASILEPAHTFQDSLTPSRSSTSSKSNAREPILIGDESRRRGESGREGRSQLFEGRRWKRSRGCSSSLRELLLGGGDSR